MPFQWQRSVDTAYVTHSHPREMCRTYKVIGNLPVGQSEFLPHTGRNSFICHQCQRHVNAVQGHPVNFLFPAFPVPVGHGVTESHHIEIIMMFERRYDDPFFHIRQFFRQFQTVSTPRGNTRPLRLHIFVETATSSNAATGIDI